MILYALKVPQFHLPDLSIHLSIYVSTQSLVFAAARSHSLVLYFHLITLQSERYLTLSWQQGFVILELQIYWSGFQMLSLKGCYILNFDSFSLARSLVQKAIITPILRQSSHLQECNLLTPEFVLNWLALSHPQSKLNFCSLLLMGPSLWTCLMWQSALQDVLTHYLKFSCFPTNNNRRVLFLLQDLIYR